MTDGSDSMLSPDPAPAGGEAGQSRPAPEAGQSRPAPEAGQSPPAPEAGQDPPGAERPGSAPPWSRRHRSPHRGHGPVRRSVRDRKVKGVAGGLAAAADVDPTLVRLLFAAAALTGWGIVAYIVLAILLRDESIDDPARVLPPEQRRPLRIGLAVAAAIAVGRLLGGGPFFGGGGIGLPLVLVAVGAAVLWARRDDGPAEAWTGPAPAEPGSPVAGSWPDPTESSPPAASWPAAGPTPPLGAGIDWRSTGHDLLRLAGAFAAVAALLALIGGTFLVAVGAVPMRLPFLPATIGVVGLLALVVAVVRRVRPAGLFFSGGVLVVAAALAVGLASFPGGTGDRVLVVGPDNPLLDRYEHGVGRLVLDLSGLSPEAGSRRHVVAKLGTGQLTVIVPPKLAVDVKARAGAGTATLFGREQSGTSVTAHGRQSGAEGAGQVDLDLSVGVGEIRVGGQSVPRLEGDGPPLLDPSDPNLPEPTTPPDPAPAPTVPSFGGAPLVCGPPGAGGDLTCRPATAGPTTTAAAPTYSCKQDATGGYTCVPA